MRPQISTIFTATTAGISGDITEFLYSVSSKPDSTIKDPRDTLERISKSVGVSLVTENDEYRMEGSWECMSAAHTLLQHLIAHQLTVANKDETSRPEANDKVDEKNRNSVEESSDNKQIPDPLVFYSHQFVDHVHDTRLSSEALAALQELIPTFDTNWYTAYLERNFGVDVDGGTNRSSKTKIQVETLPTKSETVIVKNAIEEKVDFPKSAVSDLVSQKDENVSLSVNIKTEEGLLPRRTKRKSCSKLASSTLGEKNEEDGSENEDCLLDETIEKSLDSDSDYEPDPITFNDIKDCVKSEKKPFKKLITENPKKMKLRSRRRKKSERKQMTKLKTKVEEIVDELDVDIQFVENAKKKKFDKKIVKQGRQKQSPTENKTNLPCNYCSYIGKEKSHLKEHFRRCHNSKVWKCEECGKTFGYPKDLNRHKKTHMGPQHVCDTCGKMYKADRAFEEHKKKHLVGYVKPEFECDLCHKTFSTKYVLSYHIKSEHLGMKKSYLCPTCGKSFTQKNTYVQHANVHMGIKPFVCDQCGKSFTYEKSLKEHKYMHDDLRRFPCTLCHKKFRQSSALHIHMKVHKTTKDHLCGICGKGFTQKQALLRHERIHNGDKPFCCRLCGKHFSDASIIRRHMMLIHKKDPKKWQEEVISFVEKRKDYFIRKLYEDENEDEEVQNATKSVEKHDNSDIVASSSNIDTHSEQSSEQALEESSELIQTAARNKLPVLSKSAEHLPSMITLQQVELTVATRYSHESQVQAHAVESDKNLYQEEIYVHRQVSVPIHNTVPPGTHSSPETVAVSQSQYVHTDDQSQVIVQPSEFSPISAGSTSAQHSPGTPVPYQTRNEAMEALVLAANQEYHNQRIAQEYERATEPAVDYSHSTPVPHGYDGIADPQLYQRSDQWPRPTCELLFAADPQYSQYSNQ